MATRFYFPSAGTAPVAPAFGSQWETTGSATRLPALTTKNNSSFTNPVVSKGNTTAWADTLALQFVSGTLDVAQTITGTFSAVMMLTESATAADMFWQVVLRVVSQDGSTERGVLYGGSALTAVVATSGAVNEEIGTTAATKIQNAISLSSVSAQARDRIVIELGMRGGSTTSTHTCTFRHSTITSPNTDYALTAGNTTNTNIPWLELSQTLTFASYSTPPDTRRIALRPLLVR